MSQLDLVTGAFSYSGSHVARRLLDAGHEVRTLTHHPERAHPLHDAVDAQRYRFDDPAELARSLSGVATLYNTYWVRFDHGASTYRNAVEQSRMLFAAARRAGVERIVHVSITNPSISSPLPYFRGKALVESALAQSSSPYSIVRPTMLFGGERDVLVNNIAWILRRMPVFPVPGDGRYRVQPVHVEDLARLCVEAAGDDEDRLLDAAGPEQMSFGETVALVRSAVGGFAPIVPVPSRLMALAAHGLGALKSDIVLTRDEISGLTAGLLVSHAPPLGELAFSDWLDEHADEIGRVYANELERHFDSS
jgi:nucleoside-diphosphate-sugar epimerase